MSGKKASRFKSRRKLPAQIAALLILLFLCGCGKAYQTEDIEDYAPAAVVKEYHGDLSSGLYIFPAKELAAEAGLSYSAKLTCGLFDTDGWVILHCRYDQETFEKEKLRLAGISQVIRSGSMTAENKVRFDENSYAYPAYVTIDGFGSTWEYALIMEKEQEIVYLFLAYPGKEVLSVYGEYMKKDRSVYEKTDTSAFSLYNHSFDGGKSWVEFDD